MTLTIPSFLVEMATVYKILSPCLQECYVGSTTQVVEYRWNKHKNDRNNCRSKVLFETYGVDNCKFVVLEVCPIEEKRVKEQWWMDHSVGLVNKQDAVFNMKKANRLFYDKNKERIKQYQKMRREARLIEKV